MAEITLVTATDPRRLIETAADGFLSPLRASPDDPFLTPPCLPALRQGGIRENLVALTPQQTSLL